MTDSLLLIYCPYPHIESARAAALGLLEQHLVACCNILPASESHYWWEGTLTQTTESILLCKTSLSQKDAVYAAIAETHPYACPAILSLSAETTLAFSRWIEGEIQPVLRS